MTLAEVMDILSRIEATYRCNVDAPLQLRCIRRIVEEAK